MADKYTTSTISSSGGNSNNNNSSSGSSSTTKDSKGNKDMASVLQERLTEDAGTVGKGASSTTDTELLLFLSILSGVCLSVHPSHF